MRTSLAVLVAAVVVVVGAVGCGSGDPSQEMAPTMTVPVPPPFNSPPTAPAPSLPVPSAGSSDGTDPIPIIVDPPNGTVYTTDTSAVIESVPVDQREMLERRAAEFELIDPRRDPARYLAMGTRYCRKAVSEEQVRDYATARLGGFLTEAESRQLDLLDRGTRIVRIDVYGYANDGAQVAVLLDGDPSSGSGRIRQWRIEDGQWRVDSCAG